MKYYGQDSKYILAECSSCGKVLKISIERCSPKPDGFIIQPAVKCFCGIIDGSILGTGKPSQECVKCPQCGSTQITAQKKGFGLGKAVGGVILTGGVGLLGGFYWKWENKNHLFKMWPSLEIIIYE